MIKSCKFWGRTKSIYKNRKTLWSLPLKRQSKTGLSCASFAKNPCGSFFAKTIQPFPCLLVNVKTGLVDQGWRQPVSRERIQAFHWSKCTQKCNATKYMHADHSPVYDLRSVYIRPENPPLKTKNRQKVAFLVRNCWPIPQYFFILSLVSTFWFHAVVSNKISSLLGFFLFFLASQVCNFYSLAYCFLRHMPKVFIFGKWACWLPHKNFPFQCLKSTFFSHTFTWKNKNI